MEKLINGLNRKEYDKKYREENKEKIKEQKKKWYQENKEERNKCTKKYHQENKEVISKRNKVRYKKNGEKIKENVKKWREENKEKINKHDANRRKIDPLFYLKSKIRSRISTTFKAKKWTKKSHTFDMLKLTPKEFFKYIESQFIDGMSWDNRELWQLDHKVPLAIAENEEELRKLNHYSNYQPLWAEENLKKSDKLLSKHKKLMFELIGR